MDRTALKDPKRLEVGREFRRSRLAEQWAASAYERLIPIAWRSAGSMGGKPPTSRLRRSICVEDHRCPARA